MPAATSLCHSLTLMVLSSSSGGYAGVPLAEHAGGVRTEILTLVWYTHVPNLHGQREPI